MLAKLANQLKTRHPTSSSRVLLNCRKKRSRTSLDERIFNLTNEYLDSTFDIFQS